MAGTVQGVFHPAISVSDLAEAVALLPRPAGPARHLRRRPRPGRHLGPVRLHRPAASTPSSWPARMARAGAGAVRAAPGPDDRGPREPADAGHPVGQPARHGHRGDRRAADRRRLPPSSAIVPQVLPDGGVIRVAGVPRARRRDHHPRRAARGPRPPVTVRGRRARIAPADPVRTDGIRYLGILTSDTATVPYSIRNVGPGGDPGSRGGAAMAREDAVRMAAASIDARSRRRHRAGTTSTRAHGDAPLSLEEECRWISPARPARPAVAAVDRRARSRSRAVARPRRPSRRMPPSRTRASTLNLSTYSSVPEFDFYETLMDDSRRRPASRSTTSSSRSRPGPEDPAPAVGQGRLAGRVLHRVREHRHVRRHLRRRAARRVHQQPRADARRVGLHGHRAGRRERPARTAA